MCKCLERYQDRIGKSKFDMGCIENVEYKITLHDNVKPICRRPRPYPPEHEKEIKTTIDLLLQYGLIKPYEGPWAFNVFIVFNPDGSTRMVCDYKWVNQHSHSDSYPVQSVPDMVTQFHGKTIYSSFNILKAFHNIRVEENSKKYTAFTTKYGTFTWEFMPFGG